MFAKNVQAVQQNCVVSEQEYKCVYAIRVNPIEIRCLHSELSGIAALSILIASYQIAFKFS